MADEGGELGLMRVASMAREAADAPVDRETHAAGRVRLLDAAGRIAAAPPSEPGRWTPARVLAAALVFASRDCGGRIRDGTGNVPSRSR